MDLIISYEFHSFSPYSIFGFEAEFSIQRGQMQSLVNS